MSGVDDVTPATPSDGTGSNHEKKLKSCLSPSVRSPPPVSASAQPPLHAADTACRPPLTIDVTPGSLNGPYLFECGSELVDIGTASGGKDVVDDVEDDSTSPSGVRRSQSLRSSQLPSPVTSPGAKKVVRFADSMGLDLTSITLRESSTDSLVDMWLQADGGQRQQQQQPGGAEGGVVVPTRKLSMSSRFVSPGTLSDFLLYVQGHKVGLQSCDLSDTRRTISGLIRVANVAFRKQVNVRYSFNGWNSYDEVAATYIKQDDESEFYDCGMTDLFSFKIDLPPPDDDATAVEFSLCFIADGNTWYWDNNREQNYRVELYDRF